MRDHLSDFAGSTIAAVTFAQWRDLAAHRSHLDLPFPLLADPQRQVYEQFGLGRASRRNIWNPGTLKLYTDLLRRGRKLRRPTQDTRQLGGDFVLGGDGRLVAGFWPASPDDRPDVARLIEATARAGRT